MNKQISFFDRSNLKDIRKDVQTALEMALKPYGVSVKLAGFRFTDNQFTSKMTANIGTDQKKINQREWAEWCRLYNLKVNDFGKMFTFNGKDYVITQIKPRRRKYPITAEMVQTGRSYRFHVDTVKRCLRETYL